MYRGRVFAEMRQALKRTFGLAALATSLVVSVSAGAANPGDLDATFGSGGKVTTRIGSQDSWAEAVVVQPDGKIVVGGPQGPPAGDAWGFGLARFNRDGTLDTTFGSGGKVMTSFGQTGRIEAVALQKDQKIVAAGWSFVTGGQDFAVARYNANGSLDASFGDGGRVTTDFTTGDEGNAVVIQPDSKIVVAGQTLGKLVLIRYQADGSLDPSFGSFGRVVSIESERGASALALQRDGKLVATGGVYLEGRGQFGVVRFNADGSLDGNFGSDGVAHAVVGSGVWSYPNGVALQGDGKIVAAGVWEDNLGRFNWGVVRWNRDGTLDPIFGQGGVVVTSKRGTWAGAVAVQPNGKILVTGDSQSSDGSMATLVRFQTDGALDPGFGKDGFVTTAFGDDPYNYGSALALQPDGKVLVAGSSFAPPPSNSQVGVVRFLGDPTCVVPKVKGKLLAAAKRAIRKAGCLPGKLTRRFSAKVRKGRIVSQKPGPGASVATATKVALVVSKGRKPRR